MQRLISCKLPICHTRHQHMARKARVGRSEPRRDALGAHDTCGLCPAHPRPPRAPAHWALQQQKCKVVTSRWFGRVQGYARLRTGYWVHLIAQVSACEGGINGMSSFRAALALVRSYGPNPLAAAAIGKYVTSRVRHGHYCDHRPCQTLLYCRWAW